MAKSAILCWWCVGNLEAKGGAPVFRTLPDGQRVHVCCERDALAYLKKITAQPREQGVYRE